MKKALCLIFALMLVLASCGTTDVPSESDTQSPAAETTAVAETGEPEETLGLEAKDFGGTTFTILGESWYEYAPFNYTDIVAESHTGDVMNDATFARTQAMEEKYGAKAAIVQLEYNNVLPAIEKAVNAGDKTYDIWLARGIRMPTAITTGYLMNLAEYDCIRAENPWWVDTAEEALTIYGKTFGLIGYTSTNFMKAVYIACFNKQMIADNNLESPYSLIDSGNWTLDKALEMGNTVIKDVNGNGIIEQGDVCAITYTRDELAGILNGCGVYFGKVNSEGAMEFTIDTEENIERITDIFTKLFTNKYALDVLVEPEKLVGNGFQDGQCLFVFTAAHTVDSLRQMDIDFGVVPFPKYKADENYSSSFGAIYGTISTIPVTCNDAEASAYFLEAFTYEGYKSLKPAFYDIIIQGRVAQDAESAAYLDYIFDGIVFDTGNLISINNLSYNVSIMSNTKNTNVASTLKATMKANRKTLATFNEKVKG